VTSTDTHRAIDAVWRIESARIIAGLTRIVRDIGIAEELAQDALVAALEQWPGSGIPDNPGAWLMSTAKHRAIDHWRRNKLLERKHEELGRELEMQQERSVPDLDAAIDDTVGDDLLRLVSFPVILSSRQRLASPSLFAFSAASPPTKSPVPSSSQSPPSPSASFAPSAASPKLASPSRFPASPS